MNSEKCFYIKNIAVKIHFLSVFTFIALVLSENSIYSFIVLFCALFHEIGHITAILLFRAGISEISLLPFGAEIKMKNPVGYFADFFIAIAGPAASFLLAGFLYASYLFFPSPESIFAAFSSLFLGIINLIPIKSFDGGRCVRCLAFSFFEYEKALRFVKTSELLAFLILTLFFFVSARYSGFNLSICAILLYLFFFVYSKS